MKTPTPDTDTTSRQDDAPERQNGAVLIVLAVAWAALTLVCLAIGLPFAIAALAGVVGALAGYAASSYGSWRLVLITALAGALMWLAFVAAKG